MMSFIKVIIKMKKRGQQTGGQAAVLVGIITLLLIFYILFLPPETRKGLLEDGEVEPGERLPSAKTGQNVTLVDVDVGRLDYISRRYFDKSVPNIVLIETTEANVLKKVNAFQVRNGWFDKQPGNFSLRINDLENVDNVQLSFGAKEHTGTLKVDLNGMAIFESDVGKYNVGPIDFEKHLLKNDNMITMTVSGVGLAFWRTNKYDIENLKITGDVRDVSQQVSGSIFVLEGVEYFNAANANLRFIPYCSGIGDVGKLDVVVNNRNIYSATPVCDDPARVSIPLTILNAGQNSLSFRTERGTYSVEQIRIYGDLTQSRSLTNYFELNATEFDEVVNKLRKDVMLRIAFVDDRELKQADISVNGHLTRLDQYGDSYTRNINPWLQEGNNYVSITPRTTLEIVNMQVALES